MKTALLTVLFATLVPLLGFATMEPIIHWEFEGNGKDRMGNLDILQIRGATFSDDSVRGSQAILFNQSKYNSVNISVGKFENDFTRFGYSQRTLSLWFKAFKPSIKKIKNRILFMSGEINKGLKIRVGSDLVSVTLYTLVDDQLYENYLKAPYKLETWHHIVFRFNEGNLALFLDGKLVDEDSCVTKQISSFNKGSSLGALLKISDGEVKLHSPYNGLIDDIKIFDVALSDKNIKKLFHHKQMNEALENTQLKHASAFQPQPDDNPTLANFALEKEIQSRQNNRESDKQTRLMMAFAIGLLGFLGLAIAFILGFKAMR